MIFQKTGSHFSGSCARPPVSRICVSILVCVCVCGQSCAGSNVPAARRLPPCARTPMAISSSVSRLFSWPSAFHRLSGRASRAAFLLRDILACELARSRDLTGINQFRSLPRRSASGTRAETHGECVDGSDFSPESRFALSGLRLLFLVRLDDCLRRTFWRGLHARRGLTLWA